AWGGSGSAGRSGTLPWQQVDGTGADSGRTCRTGGQPQPGGRARTRLPAAATSCSRTGLMHLILRSPGEEVHPSSTPSLGAGPSAVTGGKGPASFSLHGASSGGTG